MPELKDEYLFPSRAVYLDQDYKNLSARGVAAYGTPQTAYAAADAAQIALGGTEVVVIMVGEGDWSAQDITLTADWNQYVHIKGLGKELSKIGKINGAVATGNGFAFNSKCAGITITNIDSKSSDSDTGTGGAITIVGDSLNNVSVGALNSSAASSTGAGAVSLTNVTCTTITASNSNSGQGGNVTLIDSVATTINCSAPDVPGAVSLTRSRCTTITTSSSVSSSGGNVTVGDYSTATVITANAGTSGQTGGTISIGKYATVGNITTIYGGGGGNGGPVTLDNYAVAGNIDTQSSDGSGGAVTLGVCCKCGSITTSSGSGAGGAVIIGAGSTTGNILTYLAAHTGGDVTIGNGCTIGSITAGNNPNAAGGGTVVVGSGCTTGNIDNSMAAEGPAVNITIGEGSSVGDIVSGGCSGASIPTLTLRSGTRCGSVNFIVNGSSLGGIIKAASARITSKISNLNSASVLHNTTLSTSASNYDCVDSVDGSGSQFINCTFIPNGSGTSVTNGSEKTVIMYNCLMKNDLGTNVTLSEGDKTVSANLVAP